MSGGLFSEHEETSELPAAAANEQSQSKEAQYARAYRRDPENNRRINLQKKRRRILKKERELGSVSPMFQAPAESPAKVSQQTVESNHPEALNGNSISWPATTWDYNFQGGLIRGAYLAPRRTTQRQTSSSYVSEQDKSELEAIRRDINELKKCFKPAPSTNHDNVKGQDVSRIAITNGANVSKKKTIAKFIVEKLPTFGISLLILTFLAFNTYFLVSEQQSLYESMSYSAGMALLIAVLSEASLIMLSAMASWTPNLEWKIGLTTGMMAMVMVMVGILDSSAESRVNTAARQSQEAKNIEKQLVTLRALETPILARIEKLDPQHYRTEIDRLSKSLTTPPNGYTYKIEQLSSKLATISTANADISKMVWQRRVSLLLNLLFSSFLGFLWARNKEGVLTKISKSLGGVLNRPCEV